MKTIMGTVHNGQIVADQPVEWPEGCRVVIKRAMEEETFALREENWPTDPEGIAPLVVLMDQVEPVEITPVEEAAQEVDRKAQTRMGKGQL